MAVACTFFAAVGAVIVVAGENADRLWGVISLLIFGVCGSVWFALPRLTKTATEGVRTEVIRFRGSRQPALVFRFSKAKRRLGLLGTSAFTLVGILFVLNATALADPEDDPSVILAVGIMCVSIFGLVTVLGLANELARGSSVALMRDGILSAGVLSWFLPWDAVDEILTIDVHGTPMVGVVASDPSLVETSGIGRILAIIGRRTTGVDLAFAGLVAPLSVLADALRNYCSHPEERGRIGSAEPVSRLQHGFRSRGSTIGH